MSKFSRTRIYLLVKIRERGYRVKVELRVILYECTQKSCGRVLNSRATRNEDVTCLDLSCHRELFLHNSWQKSMCWAAVG